MVEAFAHHKGPIDLALLKVNADGLIEERDYLLLPHAGKRQLMPGDEVVAVGSPHRIRAGTHTFGRISALRDNYGRLVARTGLVTASIIQTDAPDKPLATAAGRFLSMKGTATAGLA